MARSGSSETHIKVLCWITGALFTVVTGLVVKFANSVEASIAQVAADSKEFSKDARSERKELWEKVSKLQTCCELSKRRN